jgi:hypothetical protein
VSLALSIASTVIVAVGMTDTFLRLANRCTKARCGVPQIERGEIVQRQRFLAGRLVFSALVDAGTSGRQW